MMAVQLRTVRLKSSSPYDSKWRNLAENFGDLDALKIDLKNECEKMPSLEMDESCETQRLC